MTDYPETQDFDCWQQAQLRSEHLQFYNCRSEPWRFRTHWNKVQVWLVVEQNTRFEFVLFERQAMLLICE